jgi:hypothetical protein
MGAFLVSAGFTSGVVVVAIGISLKGLVVFGPVVIITKPAANARRKFTAEFLP